MKYITHQLNAGRLGNNLFQIASVIGMALELEREYMFPQWGYNKYLEKPLPLLTKSRQHHLEEPHYHYSSDIVKWAENFDAVSIGTWLQSEKYFEEHAEKIKELFRIKGEYTRDWYMALPNNHKPTIAISIRKGKDYEDNGNYEILPITYYILALEENFPNWREDYNVMIFSDEMSYCKSHFQGDNIYYGEGIDIQQLYLMSMCDHFILANSTFSWWGAWLGEKDDSVIVRPLHYFKGELLKTHNDRDLWPVRWRSFDHKDKKIPLNDVTFTIPVHVDHTDRKDNLILTTAFLEAYFDTNIVVGEQGSNLINYRNRKTFNMMKEFHRTKMLNDMANDASTPFIVNWDADVIIPPLQILNAVYSLRRNIADVVYAYDGRFARVPRTWYKKFRMAGYDCGVFKDETFIGTRDEDQRSVGGAVFYNSESFVYGGMENENMVSYAPEDIERYERFQRLGFIIKREKGILYHFDHHISPDSSMDTPRFQKNMQELKKEQAMTDEELLEYVDSWPWVKKYSDKYYENIVEDAIFSGREILMAVQKIFPEIRTILDVSGGIGEWGVGAIDLGFSYVMTDYRANKKKLLVPEYLYKDYDLRTEEEFPFNKQFDLVVCTEVMEHLSKEHAERIIQMLCERGKIVLFSAAIPYQGGLFHVNEQWQSYWANIFANNGYFPYKYDIRRSIEKGNVSPWYKQNLVIYTPDKYVLNYPIDFVLPKMYTNIVEHYKRKGPL